MNTESRDLVVMITHGIDHELSSAGFSIALGGMTAGFRVSIFLTSSDVDIVRCGAMDMTLTQPLETLAAMLRDILARGGNLWACIPCINSGGCSQASLLVGAVVTGASVMHELIKKGAATLSF